MFYEANPCNHCDFQLYLEKREWRHPSLIFSGPQTLRRLRETERRGGAARAIPIKNWTLVSEAVRGSEPTCSARGPGSPDDPRRAGSRGRRLDAGERQRDPRAGCGRQGAGRAALTLRSPAELWCSRTPSTSTNSPRGGCSRSAPHTGIGPPTSEPLCRCEEGQSRVSRDGVVALQRPGSVDLGR